MLQNNIYHKENWEINESTWKYRFLEIYPWIVHNFPFVITISYLNKISITLEQTFAKKKIENLRMKRRKLPKCRRVGWVLVSLKQ